MWCGLRLGVKGGQPELRCGMEPRTKLIDPYVAFLNSIFPLNQKSRSSGLSPRPASPFMCSETESSRSTPSQTDNPSASGPLGTAEFVTGLERLLGTPLERRASGRKPATSVSGEQLELRQKVLCRRISYGLEPIIPLPTRKPTASYLWACTPVPKNASRHLHSNLERHYLLE